MKEIQLAARAGRPRRHTRAGAARNLLRQTEQLKEQLASFDRSAREILDWLDPRISELEIEAMSTPTANLVGTLECLLADDVGPALRKLLELDSLLRMTTPLAATVTTRPRRQADCIA